ncbi:hypothetical protein DL93DRAFT_2032844, partial [Clavulina sp. PMI_390]
MGNTASSKERTVEDETVEYGYLIPQGGIYPSASRDWHQNIVAQLIVHRKLAPFYRPLEDYEEDWTADQILAAQKKPPLPDGSTSSLANDDSASGGGSGRGSNTPSRNLEAQLYRGAVDCPICFLYYPPNINHTRCCDQAICTECFVHIKRADPTTTHLVSEPACCPYCMQSNFGVTYVPPNWRAGIGAEGSGVRGYSSGSNASNASTETGVREGKRRRKSVSHTSADVVTIDQIRPDWEAKLNAVRATVARRANRRIVMRQIGDQLIPVGITSGRVVALPPGSEGAVVIDENAGSRSGRRRRHQAGNGDLNQLLGQMGGPDLEELMVMEAMRLSMVEENERQRKAREEEAKKAAAGGTASATEGASSSAAGPASVALAPSSSSPAPPSRPRSHSPAPPSSTSSS